MKIIKIDLEKKTIRLLYNIGAMINIYDKFGDEANINELTKGLSKDSLEALTQIAGIMTEQAELYRRYFGYTPEEITTAEEIALITRPAEIFKIKNGILQAQLAGLNQEIQDEDEEIDLGLQELNKDKKKE